MKQDESNARIIDREQQKKNYQAATAAGLRIRAEAEARELERAWRLGRCVSEAIQIALEKPCDSDFPMCDTEEEAIALFIKKFDKEGVTPATVEKWLEVFDAISEDMMKAMVEANETSGIPLFAVDHVLNARKLGDAEKIKRAFNEAIWFREPLWKRVMHISRGN